VISGITDRPLVGKPGITVRVPVLRQNEVVYVLSAVVDPASFEALIQQQNVPQGWISGLVDAQDRFVARVPPRPPGTLAGDAYRAQVAASNEGWFRGPTVEGRDTFTAFARSGYSGWSVGFAIPAEVVLASAQRTAWAMSGVALLCIGLAIVAAIWVGRRISTPIGHLVDQIPTLGEGRPIEIRDGHRRSAGARRRDENRLGGHQRAAAAVRARAQGARRLGPFEGRIPRHAEPRAAQPARGAHQRRDGAAPRAAGRGFAKAQQVIERQTKQMGRLVEDLLDVSRITLGKASLHFEPVELSALVRDALRTSQQAAKLATTRSTRTWPRRGSGATARGSSRSSSTCSATRSSSRRQASASCCRCARPTAWRALR
jgi:hypothetical protein